MITPAQRELRRKHIGASDAAAILGLDQWRSREDVWAEKVYGLDDDKSNDAIELGNELEPVIVAWAGKQIVEQMPGVVIDTESPQMLHAGGVLLAHPDGVVRDANKALAPIEAKYRSRGIEWGTDESPEIPLEVLTQAYVQMACMGAAFCYVAAYLAASYGIKKKIIRHDCDPDMLKTIVDELHNFWERYVVKKQQPPASAKGPSLEVMKRIRRMPDATVTVDAQVMENFAQARRVRLDAEKAEEKAKASLLMQMCGADAAKGGGWVAIHKTSVRQEKAREAREITVRTLTVKEE
jgi:putative phage-type endonuclease